MRSAVAVFVIAATSCYAPTALEGALCGAADACPSGQQCDPATSRCVRVPTAFDAGFDAPSDAIAPTDAATNTFIDTFSRADGAAVGNGWIEKNPAAFSLTTGEVTRIATSPKSYRDNLVYRPATEDVLDVEVSIGVRFVQLPPRFAQIFVRARGATIATADSYDGYLLYVNGSVAADQVVLGRQLGTPFVVTLSQFTLAEPFTTSGRYRMVLRAQGTSPVVLTASVDKLVGATWTTIGSTTASDAAAVRIAEPGTVGFEGDEIAAYVYDEFRRAAL